MAKEKRVIYCEKLADAASRDTFQRFAEDYQDLYMGSEDQGPSAAAPGEEVAYRVRLSPEGLEAFRAASNYLGDEPVYTAHATESLAPGNPDPGGERDRVYIGVPEAHRAARKGRGSRVAVLDTGLDRDHAKGLGDLLAGERDWTGSRYGAGDFNSHGTHVLGIVHGVAPEATLLNGKVLSDSGSGGTDDIAAGIGWSVEHGATEINLSLSAQAPPDNVMGRAAQRARNRGVTVIAAAGNNGCESGNEADGNAPANHPSVVSVAATSSRDNSVASFSACGGTLDIAGPGVAVNSWGKDGGYGSGKSGTSMSAPAVAGVSALAPEFGPDDKRRALKESATTGLPSNRVGAGVVNAPGYLDALGLMDAPVPEPEPDPEPDPEPEPPPEEPPREPAPKPEPPRPPRRQPSLFERLRERLRSLFGGR